MMLHSKTLFIVLHLVIRNDTYTTILRYFLELLSHVCLNFF